MAMYRRFFLCFLLPLLATPVQSSASMGQQPWRRRPNWFVASAAESTSDDTLVDESPLKSEPVPLPKLKDEDTDVYGIGRKNPTFDIVDLPKPQRKRSRKTTKSSTKGRQGRAAPSGTRFGLRAPSPERITQWFAPCEERRKKKKKKTISLFNHDSVGMTNPVLRVDSNDNVDYETASLASTTTSSDPLEDSWIPATSSETNNHHLAKVLQHKLKHLQQDGHAAENAWFPATHQTQKSKRKWRQCRFRRRVGQGQACYERVREAALEWQFQHQKHPNEGILPVNSANIDGFTLAESASQKVQPLWSGPHTEGSRRLVTYTTTGFKSRWLPKLYTFNPVMVVYDLLDQRGPSTTYTSTAYATLKGHLLSGEERVTVALRDGTGFVDVEILSYSRPAATMRANLVWPLIGRMQQRFFEHQMDHLERVALPNPPPPPPSSQ